MPLVGKLYESLEKSNKPRKMKAWYCSQLASCPKAQYMSRVGVQPLNEIPGAKLLRFRSGHLIEEVIRPHLQEYYEGAVSNIKFYNKTLDLSGEFDNYHAESKTLIEVKSVGSHAVAYKAVGDDRHYLKMENPAYNPELKTPKWTKRLGPYPHHELQQHAYVRLLSHPDTQMRVEDGYEPLTSPWEVEKIVYLYITLDGLMLSYETEVKPKYLKEIDERLHELNVAWKTKIAPECLCENFSHKYWPGSMRYCPFRDGYGCCDSNLIRKVEDDSAVQHIKSK